ncbi:hypothetical protein [Streptomyces sp. MUSC 125]|nr:hypothetical protein [Streptomyces sp. MUSC 125]
MTGWALLGLLAVALLALRPSPTAGAFASAHTPRQALANTEPEIIPCTTPVRDERDTFRGSGDPGSPVGIPQAHDQQRGPASSRTRTHPSIADRTTETAPSVASGTPHPLAPGKPRAHAPAALQVFRC